MSDVIIRDLTQVFLFGSGGKYRLEISFDQDVDLDLEDSCGKDIQITRFSEDEKVDSLGLGVEEARAFAETLLKWCNKAEAKTPSKEG